MDRRSFVVGSATTAAALAAGPAPAQEVFPSRPVTLVNPFPPGGAVDVLGRPFAAVLEPLLKYRHDYPTNHLLAEAKYNLGDLQAARGYFEEAVRLNPRSAADHYDLGNIYLAGNFFALAAEAYNAALSLGMQSPVLHYKLGSAYFNLRNYL